MEALPQVFQIRSRHGTLQRRPDSEINPAGKDNYLVAKEWFQKANGRRRTARQHIMMDAIFRSYPARSQLDYADALQTRGPFDETARKAWDDAYHDGSMCTAGCDSRPPLRNLPGNVGLRKRVEQTMSASGITRPQLESELSMY